MNRLAVIAGKYRGQALTSPSNPLTHPMGAREKNALFNSLDVAGARVLDVFAGSGSLGIEALSRGAAWADFVEQSRPAIQAIRSNLAKLGITNAQIYPTSLSKFLEQTVPPYDFIIADPPYGNFPTPSMFHDVEQLPLLLSPHGILVLSSPAELPPPDLTNFTPYKTSTYAAARLTFYQK